jgi:antitoxin (DNA-binding transcriptional repressor) of toxin-antitoxin stability system
MKVSAQYAATHFDDLLSAASNGEEVEIAVPDKPTLKLVISNGIDAAGSKTPRKLGGLAGMIRVPSDEEWDAMDETVWQQPERPRSELFGSLAGKMEFAPDWDSPETNKQIQDLLEGSEPSGTGER